LQNQYNLAHRGDDALIDDLARGGIAYVPVLPLGGFNPLQSSTLSDVATRLAPHRCRSRSPGCCVAHQYPADPGTSSVAHLRENLAAAELKLSDDVLRELDGVAKAA